MFRLNDRHLQVPVSSHLSYLSEKARTRLEASWAGVFYREFFCRLDEKPFAVLYADIPSRPNEPVNVIVGLETLKAGFGWSDEEMYDHFLFDVQVRYALGYRNLGEGDFDLRTVYNFRHRLSEHMHKTGKNLIDEAFTNITDKQIIAFELQTGRLRMDSAQIASNIRRMSRLQLLVEVLQRVQRMLTEADQGRYAAAFAPYLKGSSGQYIYHLKGEETEPHLQRIGELMHRLLVELAPGYAEDPVYLILQRVFQEQFILHESVPQAKADDAAGGNPPPGQLESEDVAASTPVSGATPVPTVLATEPEPPNDAVLAEPVANALPVLTVLATEPVPPTQEHTSNTAVPLVQVRPGQEISPCSLRSPDDPEATYRKKGQQAYEGYATNLTETCDPKNPFQLIVKVQTAPNHQEDTAFLLEAVPELKARTGVHTLYNDGTFCSPEVDKVLRAYQIEQVPTALRGRSSDPSRTALADYRFQFAAEGQPVRLTCPHGYQATVEPGKAEGRYIARWEGAPCAAGCFHKAGNTALDSPKVKATLRFSQADLGIALRRQRSQAYHEDKQSLRAAIKAAVGAVKRPFNDDQLPVRGTFRVGLMMIESAAMVNIRRIQRYLVQKSKSAEAEQGASQPAISFLSALWERTLRWLQPNRPLWATVAFGF